MSNLNESSIETFAIELFESLGWQYAFGYDIAPDAENTIKRNSFEEVLLLNILEAQLRTINPQIPEEAIQDAVKTISNIPNQYPNLLANNEAFHRLLTEGIRVTYRKNAEEKGEIVKLIDFKNPTNNHFFVVNQFTVVENDIHKRPDIVLFVNGIPLVVFELKNPADENTLLHTPHTIKFKPTNKLSLPFFAITKFLLYPMGWKPK